MYRYVMFAGLAACWTSSAPPASPPPASAASTPTETDTPPEAPADTVYESATGPSTGGGGKGIGNGLGASRTPPTVSVSSAPSSSTAGLDKAVIRRVIRQHLPAVRYCYEKELITQPTLQGTVTVKFVIAADGSVASAAGSGLPVVDACVATVVQKMVFPKPRGGGTVNVSYPFKFVPS